MALRKIGTINHGTAEVRIYRDAEWNEYRARLYIGGVLQESADYHTDDKHDAFATGDVIAMNTNIRTMQGACNAQ